MATVVGVRFKTVGKVYYFDPAGKDYPLGSRVIVETSRGIECGEVAMKNREVPDDPGMPFSRLPMRSKASSSGAWL